MQIPFILIISLTDIDVCPVPELSMIFFNYKSQPTELYTSTEDVNDFKKLRMSFYTTRDGFI